MENITLTGIDLSKEVFAVRCENHCGRLVKRQVVRRGRLLEVMRELPRGSTVAMEACASAHYWAREFERLGLKALMIAPQFVTPYRRSSKNDANDAEAICEAARRPNMRFVGLKSEAQLDLQMLHRVRERLIKEQTALINQMRGLLLERGFVVARGVALFVKNVTKVVTALGRETLFGATLNELWEEFENVQKRVAFFTEKLKAAAKTDESCVKLLKLGGVGVLTATAAVAAIGAPQAFKNGRCFAASLGLVPRQFTTGGKVRLGSITKRGDCYLRKLLVHGGRAMVQAAVKKKKQDRLSLWIRELYERTDANRAAVALANKNARQIWAILAGKRPLDEQLPQAA